MLLLAIALAVLTIASPASALILTTAKATGPSKVAMRTDEPVAAVFAAGSCTYALSPDNKTLSYKGGTVNVRITAQGPTSSCPAPDIVPAEDWITPTNSKFSGIKGQVQLIISTYDSSILRSGSVSIGGTTVNIIQNGKPCALALNAPSSDLFPHDGGTGDFTVTATPADCAWQAAPSTTSVSWITITSDASGTGTGDVSYTTGEYDGKGARTGKILITTLKKSRSFKVKQSHKSMLEGNPAFHASTVAGYQALGAGISYPFVALQLASPTDSLIHSLSAMIPRSLGDSRVASQATLTPVPELNLYTDGGILNGNVSTISFYTDAAGTHPAGTAVVTLPTDLTDLTDPTSYSSYPALVTVKINLTGGNLPCKGTIMIIFTGDTGANSMTGTMTLTKDDVVFNLDLALSDAFEVSGSITVKESAATLLLTNVQGAVFDTLTCDVNIDPYGWTGTGTINLLTGALTANVDTGAGTSAVASDNSDNLDINYADGAQEIVINPLAAGLTEGVTATSGTGQKATINTAFASPLVATVKDSDGNPVSGMTVTFSSPASGASCSFAGGETTATTDASGVATSANVTANGTMGSYTVTATATGATSLTGFQLTNLAGNSSGPVGFAYVANSFGVSGPFVGSVSQYAIGADGTLTPLNPPTVVGGSQPSSVTVDPSGKYVYVGNRSGGVSQYTIGTDGTLSPMNPATVGAGRAFVAVDPLGTYAYVANWDTETVSQYTISTDGTLAPLNPATVAVPAARPSFVVVDPSGRYVYVANDTAGTIAQYTIGTNGTLTPMNPPTISLTATPTSIAVDPSGKYAYVGNNNGNAVFQYTIGPDGTLAPMSPATVLAVFGPNSVAVDPSGRYAYAGNNNGVPISPDSVSQYTIGTDGTLAPMSPASVPAGSECDSVTVDPSGKYVYVTNFNDDSVSQYTIGKNGTLTPMTPATVATGISPVSVITVSRHQ
jgi:6-phosphogluconolactonase (cycloisomerase 2 family)